MTTAKPFAFEDLASYKKGAALPGYPPNIITLFSPEDDVHGALLALVASATRSLVLNMFTYTDADLDAAIHEKLADEKVYVQMSLDKDQSAVKNEQGLLKGWAGAVGNSIAIGNSAKGAYSHLKLLVVDGIYTVDGSTNWTASAETKQDNSVRVFKDPVIAAESRAILDLNHSSMLKQMGGKGAP